MKFLGTHDGILWNLWNSAGHMTDEDTAAVLAVELEEPNPTMQPLENDQRYVKWDGFSCIHAWNMI